MKSTGSYIFILFLVVLLVLFLYAKPSPEWIQAQMDKVGAGQAQSEDEISESANELEDGLKSKPTSDTESTPIPKPNEKVTSVMYQWKDDNGNIQFTEKPPVDRPYKEMEVKTRKGTQARQTLYTSKPPIGAQTNDVDKRKLANVDNKSSSKGELSLQCRNRYSSVERFEAKLEKEKSVPQSIWLQDYCSALADFIHEGCVLPKSEVKFNAYCPLRFKR